MAVKTITIDLEAYGLLSHHKTLGQSFSQVIKAHFGRRPTVSAFRTVVAGLRTSDDAINAMDAQVRARGRHRARAAKL